MPLHDLDPRRDGAEIVENRTSHVGPTTHRCGRTDWAG
jgi:hypothetical protein